MINTMSMMITMALMMMIMTLVMPERRLRFLYVLRIGLSPGLGIHDCNKIVPD